MYRSDAIRKFSHAEEGRRMIEEAQAAIPAPKTPPATEKHCSTVDEFWAAYQGAREAGRAIDRCDDIKRLRLGFVVPETATHYTLSIHVLKAAPTLPEGLQGLVEGREHYDEQSLFETGGELPEADLASLWQDAVEAEKPTDLGVIGVERPTPNQYGPEVKHLTVKL